MTGEFLAFFAGVCFALGSLFVRGGTGLVDRRVGLFLSLVTNTLLLAGVAVVVGLWQGVSEVSASGVAFYALAGVAGSLIGRRFALGSIHRLGPSRSSLYKNTQPVITTILAVSLLHEPFALLDAAGGVLVLAGILSSSRADADPSDQRGVWSVQPGQRRLGIQLGLLGALGYGVANVLRKLGIDAWPEPALGAAIGVFVALAASSLPGSLPGLSTMRRQPRHGVLCYAAFGVCSATAQLLFLLSLQHTTVWTANVLMSMEPVLTILLSALLFRGRERFPRQVLLSAALVIGGSVLIVT